MINDTNKVYTISSENHETVPIRVESALPKAYRLIMQGDGNGNTLPALQGLFTWTEGNNCGSEWRTLETQEYPFLDDSIPFGPVGSARRPKPPSEAEEALEALDEMNAPLGNVTASRCDIIRRALERLQELEALDD